MNAAQSFISGSQLDERRNRRRRGNPVDSACTVPARGEETRVAPAATPPVAVVRAAQEFASDQVLPNTAVFPTPQSSHGRETESGRGCHAQQSGMHRLLKVEAAQLDMAGPQAGAQLLTGTRR